MIPTRIETITRQSIYTVILYLVSLCAIVSQTKVVVLGRAAVWRLNSEIYVNKLAEHFLRLYSSPQALSPCRSKLKNNDGVTT